MRIPKTNVIAFFGLLLAIGQRAFADDSIPVAKELDELVVTSERAWIEDGKINFLPTKKEKQLSNSPESLLKSMHIPVLVEQDGVLVGLTGESPVYFINGERATATDISTFWPQNVKCVQYIANPTDPKFGGASTVINFIVHEYETGGVTKLSLFQKWPVYGSYRASSKIAYKNMTFGAEVDYLIDRDKPSDTNNTAIYRDLYYDGIFYNEINSTESSEKTGKSDVASAVINAKYAKNDFYAIHTASLLWNKDRESGFTILDDFNPKLFNSKEEGISSLLKSISPQLSGEYFGKFSDKWALAGSWTYAYARNDRSSCYQLGDNPQILNNTKEDVNSLYLGTLATLTYSRKWVYQLKMSYGFNRYATDYSGTASAKETQDIHDFSAVFRIHWMPNDNFRISGFPGISGNIRKFGDSSHTTLYPTMNAGIDWSANRKFSITGNLKFHLIPTSASQTNPVMTRQTELFWIAGNESLKNTTLWDSRLSLLYLPYDWLTVSGYAAYSRTNDENTFIYSPADKDYGGLIKHFINTPAIDQVVASVSLSGRFFNNSLAFSVSPMWIYTKVHDNSEFSGKSLDNLFASACADYTLGNVRFSLRYQGPSKGMTYGGLQTVKTKDNWTFNVSYGLRNLFLEFEVRDIFHTKNERQVWYDSSYFTSSRIEKMTGRYFVVSASYTFDYGKKIDRMIDMKSPVSLGSSVLY